MAVKRSSVPTVLPGEDRSLGGSSLYIDLVPRPCWNTAARETLASNYEWKRIREMVYLRALDSCEVCGIHRDDLPPLGYPPRLHAHERYVYETTEDGRHVQRLARLIAQCVRCDEVTHFGRTSVLGEHYEERAMAHAMEVNGWSLTEFHAHLAEARRLWEERNEYDWDLDPSLLWVAGGRLRSDLASFSRTVVSPYVEDAAELLTTTYAELEEDAGGLADCFPADPHDPENWSNR